MLERRRVNTGYFAVLALMLAGGSLANATTYVFATASGAIVNSQPVNVQVTLSIDPSTDLLTVQILNFESGSNVRVDTQLVSSIEITLTNLNSSATPAPSVQSSSFNAINIDKNTDKASIATTPANTWGFGTAGAYSQGANILTFCTTCPNGGNNDLIIGAPDANNAYTNANSSITNASHQPFIYGSGTSPLSGALAGINANPQWVLYVPQMTATTTATAVQIGYGTGWGLFSSQAPPVANLPETSPSALVVTGLLGMGLMAWSKKRKARVPVPVVVREEER